MKPSKTPLSLVLFMTYGMSLRRWDEAGLLTRELRLYHTLVELGVSVSLVSYGLADEEDYSTQLGEIRVLTNRWRLPLAVYRRVMPLLFPAVFQQASLLKTNQFMGASVAYRVARFWRKPFVLRCGYLNSIFMEEQHGLTSPITQRAHQQEAHLFPRADAVVVTTADLKAALQRRVPRVAPVYVVPNYVDTDHFTPLPDLALETDLITVARLETQKNLAALLTALRHLPGVTLRIIGTGTLETKLKRDYADLAGRVIWQGLVPHDQLPTYLNRSRLFVLVSHYEGHPKALIEAMACALPVLGTCVPGISDLIQHERTGYLCATDFSSIGDAVQYLLNHPEYGRMLGHAARYHVKNNYDLNSVTQQELTLYREVIAHRSTHGIY